MGCAWRRARHKRHYGQCIDITFAPQHPRARPAQSLPQGAQGKEVEQWQSGADHMSGFTKEQHIGVMQMLDLDATPQEGMIFHCAGQASGGWRVFDIWDFAVRVRPLPEGSLSPLRNRGINMPSGCPADHHLLAECTGIRVLHCYNTTK